MLVVYSLLWYTVYIRGDSRLGSRKAAVWENLNHNGNLSVTETSQFP